MINRDDDDDSDEGDNDDGGNGDGDGDDGDNDVSDEGGGDDGGHQRLCRACCLSLGAKPFSCLISSTPWDRGLDDAHVGAAAQSA